MKALLIIDVQQGFDSPRWGKRNNPKAETNMLAILSRWRHHKLPVIHVQHDSTSPESPLFPGSSGHAFKPDFLPHHGERVFSKTVNSAFIGTGLVDYLREQGIKSLVIVGLTTDHCVSTTTRMAGNLGFQVSLIADATATFDRQDRNGTRLEAQQIHDIHLASLDGEFCQVLDTAELLNT